MTIDSRRPTEHHEDEGNPSAMAHRVGAEGEELAVSYLESAGLTIVERNYRVPQGEIDVVCLDPQGEGEHAVLVFVEVKARRDLQYGLPLESLSEAKMRRVFLAAEMYMIQRNLEDMPCRFDVIGILYSADQAPLIEYERDVMDY